MQLHTIWFIIIVAFWIGFFILEGFDFGVGMLHMVVGKSDVERRVAITTIGPWWDGNEVWLIVAGASMFAAFPLWYATLFSGAYLALLLVLVALMFRGVSLEYRGKREDIQWRGAWSWALTISSGLVPLLIGVALGDLLAGLPINHNHDYTGNFFDLLTGYGLMTGATLLALCLLQGSTFLALRTTDEIRDRARAAGRLIGGVAVLVNIAWIVWTLVVIGGGTVPEPTQIFGLIAVIFAAALVITNYNGWAFVASSFGIAAAIGQIFIALYPNVMISSTNSAYNLTVSNAASGHYALVVMTIVALLLVPGVLLYQGWSFRVFHGRVIVAPAAGAGVSPPQVAPDAVSTQVRRATGSPATGDGGVDPAPG